MENSEANAFLLIIVAIILIVLQPVQSILQNSFIVDEFSKVFKRSFLLKLSGCDPSVLEITSLSLSNVNIIPPLFVFLVS